MPLFKIIIEEVYKYRVTGYAEADSVNDAVEWAKTASERLFCHDEVEEDTVRDVVSVEPVDEKPDEWKIYWVKPPHLRE